MKHQIIRSVWASLPATKLEKLVERMPNICKAVIEADGGYFVEKKSERKEKCLNKLRIELNVHAYITY